VKILMTTDTVGGVWTYVLDLSRALEPLGCEITLATMGHPLTPDQRRDARARRDLVVRESTYKLEWMPEPWKDVAAAGRWLLKLEHEVRPDVVHLNGYAHAALPFRAPIVVVAHSCVLSWWRAVKGEPAPASWERYRDLVAAGLDGADVVVAPTDAMLRTLADNYGPRRRRGQVISNGRDPARFRRGTKETFVLAAGRLWDEAKNVAALQDVGPRLPWPVCVAGEERPPDGCDARGYERRVEDNLLRLGRLSAATMAGWYARAAIYALPARYEPFGLSAVEAGLSSCALVLGDIPSLREVWGDAAVFVPPGDRDALSEAIRRFIDDGHLRENYARRARVRAAHFSLSRMGGAYANLYERMLSQRAAIDAGQHVAIAAAAASPATQPARSTAHGRV
jgi:glycosyltransferase involved in cell wall biosynthesis